jgi:hypothetical protein
VSGRRRETQRDLIEKSPKHCLRARRHAPFESPDRVRKSQRSKSSQRWFKEHFRRP